MNARYDRYAPDHERQERIADWLTQRFLRVPGTRAEDVDPHRPFTDYQVDSATALEIGHELSAWIGSELPITLFWDYPSIAALSEALAASDERYSTL